MRTCLGLSIKVTWYETFKKNIKQHLPISWFTSCTATSRQKNRKPWKRSANDGTATTSTAAKKAYEIDSRPQAPKGAIAPAKSSDLHRSRSSDIHVGGISENQRTELIENLHELLDSDSTQPTEVVCDVLFWHVDGTRVRRRLFLDPKTLVNVMADEVRRDLGEELGAYDGPSVCVNGQNDVKPLAKIKTKYELTKGGRVYEDEFLVIKCDTFDVLLGENSIRKHGLHRNIPSLAGQLR